MKILRYLAIVMLIGIVSSTGIAGIAFSESHNVAPLTAESEAPLYEGGDTVTIRGAIKDYDRTDKTAVTVIILDPLGTIVSIAQVSPNEDTGEYEALFKAAGPLWKLSGEYTAKVKYGSQPAEVTFQFTGGEALTCGENQELVNGACIDKEPPPPITCGLNEKLEDGVCVPKETEGPQCGENQILVDGQCMDKEPEVEEPVCGAGTVLVDGQCVPEQVEEPEEEGGGCLIATATFGSELAPQVQFLREIRDNTVLSTASGTSFMTAFNSFYYSFSPAVADLERQNPMFKETVKFAITPLLSSLSLLQYVDIDSEAEMLGYGIGIILLNIGMYFVAPALIVFKLKNRK
ncbi:MAG: CFI-box-CTERM domain-containing protein [Nitrososphaerota archaeon]